MSTPNPSFESHFSSAGFIPVFYHADEIVCLHVLKVCYDSGLRFFEFTNRGENAFHLFEILHEKRKADYPDMKLGVGTIFNMPTATKFIDAGADFIVSPALVPEMKAILNRVPWIPGCATVSEINLALELGAQLIKVFPGDLLGPAFIKSVRSVLPQVQLMPTGGVEPELENLKAWFNAGVVCVGMGSKLFTPEILKNQDWSLLAHRLEQTRKLIQAVRQPLL